MSAMSIPLFAYDWNRAVPFVLLGMLWLVVWSQVIGGLRHGRMREFRRALFAMYVLFLILIPVMIAAALRTPETVPPRNPGSSAQNTGS